MAVMGSIRKRKGFTLIEVVVVMAIIAVLAALIVGAILIARSQSRDTKYTADAKTIRDMLEAYYTDNKHYPRQSNGDFYSRVNGYSFFDKTVTVNQTRINANEELKKYLNGSPAPTGDPDRICYTTYPWANPTDATDYALWIITEDEYDHGERCNVNGSGGGKYNAGIDNAFVQIHCPQSSSCSVSF